MATIVFQLCRHVGKAISVNLLGNVSNQGEDAFEKPLHMNTITYIYCSAIPLIIEGLYGKDPVMIQFCSSCLKNLATIDSRVGDILVPFLLSALDPAAVNQTHQAPVAMQTISLCFKALLYPRPVVLKYLPELLRLSLPGLDASDVNKTNNTLSMYSGIFSWIPIQSKYIATKVDSYPPEFISLAQSVNGPIDRYQFTQDQLQLELDLLGSYLQEWICLFFDKIFILLESQEAHVKNSPVSPIVSAIGQCVSYVKINNFVHFICNV